MELSSELQDMLDGKLGRGKQMAVEILLAVGECFEAQRLVPIRRAHVSLSAQEADIWFAGKLLAAGATCAVSPTVNPGYSIEYFHNRKGLLSEEALANMKNCHSIYKNLGAVLSYSCTPYLGGNTPLFGELCAFSETSATVYVNSVLGARTNRESAASALCAAITGYTPEYGMLLPQNRVADTIVEVKAPLREPFDFSLLGLMGKKIGKCVPAFVFDSSPNITTEGLIALGTQLNVSGVCDLYHIPGITPEAPDLQAALGGKNAKRHVVITADEMRAELDRFSPRLSGAPEYVLLGCPHYTYVQVEELLRLLNGRKSPAPIYVLTSAAVKALCELSAVGEALESSGVELIPDTCVDEVCCWHRLKNRAGLTDSPKCNYYMSTFSVSPTVRSAADCIRILFGEAGI